MKNQRGIGLMEVLVALVILAIAILGFAALQLRAVAASIEAGNNIQATNFARDLSERMRVNRSGLSVVQGSAGYIGGASGGDCVSKVCTDKQLMAYDFHQVKTQAEAAGMQLAVRPCAASTLKRSCIYVAWDDTNPTVGTLDTDCVTVNNGVVSYQAKSKCIVMEVYSYVEED